MTEYWKSSQQNYWCAVCKTFVRDSLQGKALHENGPRHKELVEKKLREARRSADRQEVQEERTRTALDKIESLAQKQFEADQKAFAQNNNNNNNSRARQPSLAEQQRRKDEEEADLEVKKAAERAYRQQQQHHDQGVAPSSSTAASTSSSKSKISDWTYDPNSGYYFSNQASCYYDSYSTMYYYKDGWHKEAPDPNEAAKFEKYYPSSSALTGGGVGSPKMKQKEEGAVGIGPAARDKQQSVTVPNNNLPQSSSRPSPSPSPQSQQPQPRVFVVKPVKKMAQRTNQSLGGYQMPLYGGQVGGQKNIGKTITTAAPQSKSNIIISSSSNCKAKVPKPTAKGLGPKTKTIKKRKKAETAEERKALEAREAAKRRVESRTRANFGFS